MFRVPALVLALLSASVLPVAAQSWTYTGGDGQTVTLDEQPVRIIASQDAAAGLIPLGIRPVGIYADSAVTEAKALQGLDLTGIEIVGQAWGEVDIEKAAALEPDLIVAEFWPLETTWSGGDDNPVLTLAADKPAFFVTATVDAPGYFSDNALTLLPGRPAKLAFTPRKNARVTRKALADSLRIRHLRETY